MEDWKPPADKLAATHWRWRVRMYGGEAVLGEWYAPAEPSWDGRVCRFTTEGGRQVRLVDSALRLVIEQVEARGFELAEKSEINANPRDTRDHQGGVWALPPTLRNGDQDREKYVAIGESDRMTLRFRKPAR